MVTAIAPSWARPFAPTLTLISRGAMLARGQAYELALAAASALARVLLARLGRGATSY